MRLIAFALLVSSLTGCAVVDKKSILLDVEPATPLDESDLQKHCDFQDPAACSLLNPDRSAMKGKFALVQGVAPPDRAVFAALVPKDSKFSWFVYDRAVSRLSRLNLPKLQSRGKDPWAVQRIEVRGLETDRDYELFVSSPEGEILDNRVFRPLTQQGRTLKIALVGGLNELPLSSKQKIAAKAFSSSPDLVIWLGNNVNALLPKKFKGERAAAKDFFFSSYARTQNSMDYAFAPRLYPIAAALGDIEYGQAKGNRLFSFRDQAREVLEIFFPHWSDELYIVDGPGASELIRVGKTDLGLIDSWSFRAPPVALPPRVCTGKGKKKVCEQERPAPPPPGARYGVLQMQWVLRQAQKGTGPFFLFANEPWLGRYTEEWFSQAPAGSAALSSLKAGGYALVESDGRDTLSVRATEAGK